MYVPIDSARIDYNRLQFITIDGNRSVIYVYKITDDHDRLKSRRFSTH